MKPGATGSRSTLYIETMAKPHRSLHSVIKIEIFPAYKLIITQISPTRFPPHPLHRHHHYQGHELASAHAIDDAGARSHVRVHPDGCRVLVLQYNVVFGSASTARQAPCVIVVVDFLLERHVVMRPLSIHARITKGIQGDMHVPFCLSDGAATTSAICHRCRAFILGRSAMPSAVRQHSAVGIITAEEDAEWVCLFENEYCRGPTFVKPLVAIDGPQWGCAHHF